MGSLMRPICPDCSAPIPLEDISVEKDTALCRACGTMHTYASLVHGVETPLAPLETTEPPSGASFRDLGDRYIACATTRSAALAGFMLFFTAFWNSITWVFVAIAITGLLGALNVSLPPWWPAPPMSGPSGMGLGMSIFMLLFMTPFVLIGLLTLALALMGIAGRCEVEIRGAEGRVRTGVGPLRWTRRFDAGAVRSVSIERAGSTTNGKPDRHIVLEGERSVSFGTMLTPVRRRWMAAMLRTLLVPGR